MYCNGLPWLYSRVTQYKYPYIETFIYDDVLCVEMFIFDIRFKKATRVIIRVLICG